MIVLCFLIFTLSPIASLPFSIWGLYRNCHRRSAFGYIFFIAAAFSVLAFHIKPEIGWDVYQYYMRMQQMQSLSTLEAAKNAIEGFQVESLSYYLMYIISKTGKFGLYAAISTFFTYMTCLSITCSLGQRKGYSRKEILFMIGVLLTWLASDAIFSGIRYNMAYTFFILALFMEYVNKNKKVLSIILYICALLTHASITLFVILRMILPLCRKNRMIRNVLFFFMSFWSLFFGRLESMLSRLTVFNVGYLSQKVSTYSNVQTGGNLGIYVVRYDRLFLCLMLALFLVRFLREKEYDTNKDPEILSAQVGLLVFGSFNRLIYISRFFQVFAALTPFFIVEFMRRISNRVTKMFVVLFLIFSSMVLFYNQISVFEITLDVGLGQLLTPLRWIFG